MNHSMWGLLTFHFSQYFSLSTKEMKPSSVAVCEGRALVLQGSIQSFCQYPIQHMCFQRLQFTRVLFPNQQLAYYFLQKPSIFPMVAFKIHILKSLLTIFARWLVEIAHQAFPRALQRSQKKHAVFCNSVFCLPHWPRSWWQVAVLQGSLTATSSLWTTRVCGFVKCAHITEGQWISKSPNGLNLFRNKHFVLVILFFVVMSSGFFPLKPLARAALQGRHCSQKQI